MVVELPGLGAPQSAAVTTPAQRTFHPMSHASTIASQAEKSEEGNSVLDCLLFIPRQIWNFIQTIFCCKTA
ncbi:MAG: hypothetical protein K940chlam2_01420, partial [Chlamydiae bacterium]|nr:hypothetical protein [Chlamydiota bacterium]